MISSKVIQIFSLLKSSKRFLRFCRINKLKSVFLFRMEFRIVMVKLIWSPLFSPKIYKSQELFFCFQIIISQIFIFRFIIHHFLILIPKLIQLG
jgi:hypothetical protein